MGRRTYCRICETACGLIAEVDAAGAPIRLRPDRDHPVSRGFACAKGTRFAEVATHPQRLRHPEIRGDDGARRRASWEEAIAAIAARLRPIRERHGPHAVAVYFGNPMAFNALGGAALGLFVRELGTRNVFSAASQDCNNKFAAARLIHGSSAIHPIPDFDRADLAVVLGSNPYVSQSSFVHLEEGARVFDRLIQRGGHAVWIDPRRTESARRWGEHLAIRPGADAWLLAGVLGLVGRDSRSTPKVRGIEPLWRAVAAIPLAEIATRTGLDEAAIRRLADQIRSADRVAIHMSVGVNHGGFGTLCYALVHAIAHAAGSYDREGGLVFHPSAPLAGRLLAAAGMEDAARSRIGQLPRVLGGLPGGVLADEILTPGPERVRALICVAGDPLRSIPGGERLERALDSLEALFCIDLFENATGARAHALLPATSWLERWDVATTTLFLQVAKRVQMVGPVCAPPGEARPEARILADLAVALGSRSPAWRLARLPLDRWLPAPVNGVPAPGPRAGRWRRPAKLWNETIASELARLRQVPKHEVEGFVLIGRRRRLGHNSWIHAGVRAGDGDDAVAALCPADLASLGLHDGALVEIGTEAGTLVLPARADPDLGPRMVCVPHGLGSININAIIPSGAEAIEAVSGQHIMTGVPVRVRPAGQAHSRR
jgi:anaerobic selenocysteine-containing dehydrogenase